MKKVLVETGYCASTIYLYVCIAMMNVLREMPTTIMERVSSYAFSSLI